MPLYNKYPRLPTDYYRGPRATFVTICCAKRRPVFTDISTGKWAISKLIDVAAKHGFSLHAYCLMPDHLHLLVTGMHDSCDLLKFIHAFKQQTAYEYKLLHSRQLWQTRFYDHILRSADAIENVACYIWINPVRKGLCADPHLYPLSGSQTMEWMKHSLNHISWVPPWRASTPPG